MPLRRVWVCCSTSPARTRYRPARWWDGRPTNIHQRRCRYVLRRTCSPPSRRTTAAIGSRRSTSWLTAWMAALAPAERREPHSFIIDVAGELRVAPRRSEQRGMQKQNSWRLRRRRSMDCPPPHRCREWNAANDQPLDQWDRRRQGRTRLGFGLCCSDTLTPTMIVHVRPIGLLG